MKSDEFDYQDELYISVDFKKVRYDGRVYKVSSVEMVNPELLNAKHKCIDGCEYTVDLDRYITYEGVTYRVSFCNKCKTLFLSPIL